MTVNTNTVLSALIDQQIAAGVPASVAGAITAEIYAAGRIHALSVGAVGVLGISSDGAGSVLLQQADSAVSMPDYEAVRVARAILAAAGYGDVSFYRSPNGMMCYDLEDDDAPDTAPFEKPSSYQNGSLIPDGLGPHLSFPVVQSEPAQPSLFEGAR